MTKPTALTCICLFAASLLITSSDSRADDLAPSLDAPPKPQAPWSILGAWTATHPDWTDTITIAGDGTFSRTQNHWSGHWTLTTLRDHVILVLAWDNWPAETVTMLTPDEFSGSVRGSEEAGEMTLHRVQKTATIPLFETKTWQQGQAPIRLIRKEEGFCALTAVTGSFQGGGEIVKVYVADDGYWYLGGESQQEGVAAECIIVRYRSR